MDVVVTGGTGLIGVPLCQALLRADHKVTVITRDVERARRRLPAACHLEEWDGKNRGPWEAAVASARVVINLAGENIGGGRWTARQKEKIVVSRVEATEALVRAMGERNSSGDGAPSLLISASGKDYYGDRGESFLEEDADMGGSFLASTVAQWEEAAGKARERGSDVVCLRLGLVLAPGGALDRMVLPYRLFVGGTLGSGRQWLSWIHRTDVIRLILFLIDTHKPGDRSIAGPINTVAPEPVTMKQFGQTIGRVLKRPHWLPVPSPILRLALGEMADLMLPSQRVVPARAKDLGFSYHFDQLEPALADILRRD